MLILNLAFKNFQSEYSLLLFSNIGKQIIKCIYTESVVYMSQKVNKFQK